MKIAFVSTILHYPWGGADSLWTSTAEVAARNSHRLFLALAKRMAAHRRIRALIGQGAMFAPRYRHANTGARRWRWRQTLEQIAGRQPLLRQLKQFDPAVVCLCQGGTGDFLLEPDLTTWMRQAKVPYVIICQANRDDMQLSPDDQKRGRDILGDAKAVVFVSSHNRMLAERQFETALPHAVEIQNPPPPRASWPVLAWPPSPPIKFATVSRLECNAKGLDMLFASLAQALGHEKDWQLDCYGQGPDEKQLRALAAQNNLSDRVHFKGFANDVTAIWQDHHMMLLPSRVEGCSIAMMEAALCGRPVLATPVGGVDQWIRDGETGFITTGINQAALTDTLRRAWITRHEWSRMGVIAKKQADHLLDPNSPKKLLDVIASEAS